MTLPKLFVVGDSISVGYSPYLEKMTQGIFQFYGRKTGMEEALLNLDIPLGSNIGDSSMVLNYLRTMLTSSEWRPDLLILNCGLHDIKIKDGSLQIQLEDYCMNIKNILGLLADKKIKVIWVRTTPVEDEQHNSRQNHFKRCSADLAKYNAAADKIMNEYGVKMIDLHAFTSTLGKGGDIYRDHVHYYPEIEALQAAYIAGFIQSEEQIFNKDQK